MLKRSFCCFLIVLLSISSFTRLFYFAGYELNKTYIATVLCINKNKPELNCNGKCFLSKKIAEAEKKQQSDEKKIQKDLSQQVMIVSTFKINFQSENLSTYKTLYQKTYYFQKVNSIFHPPPFIV